ncbi:hypothetical protein E4T56_gene16915 [Termitomyces sp. T112]|nr:hypothetical protein E4T56_gene16915 [Termitomyces sp. T112]
MNNNPATWHARMLLCKDTTAPKWDESYPRELPQYFKELEYLFAECGIANNTQKKEYTSRYISYDIVETWLGLPEFGNNIIIGNNAPRPYTYQEWKAAVLRLYPGADTSTHDTPTNSSPSNSTPAPAAKPVDKGKAPECIVANKQLPIAKEPIAQPSINPFLGIPGCYIPPTNRNFAAPDRSNNGAY